MRMGINLGDLRAPQKKGHEGGGGMVTRGVRLYFSFTIHTAKGCCCVGTGNSGQCDVMCRAYILSVGSLRFLLGKGERRDSGTVNVVILCT